MLTIRSKKKKVGFWTTGGNKLSWDYSRSIGKILLNRDLTLFVWSEFVPTPPPPPPSSSVFISPGLTIRRS
ncbi:hypothetical protein QVD17_23275 [Tagetes erecta]|uniref:Uncharacterized protein n=1 Tax=Tagetes erecta TaxID=13708 RepID=A0AAD8KGF9_TARER|nr:hypothetical protein QVD17_23275 [Tagetes erecta]